MDYLWTFVCISLLFSSCINVSVKGNVYGANIQTFKFTMAELKALNTGEFVNTQPADYDTYPDEMKKKSSRKGGVRMRNTRPGT